MFINTHGYLCPLHLLHFPSLLLLLLLLIIYSSLFPQLLLVLSELTVDSASNSRSSDSRRLPDHDHGSYLWILEAGKELKNQELEFGKERRYLVEGLQVGRTYEVKVSYPSSLPARFFLSIQQGDEDIGREARRGRDVEWIVGDKEGRSVVEEGGGFRSGRRILLDVEKVVFEKGGENSEERTRAVLVLTVQRGGVESRSALTRSHGRSHVTFNIGCEAQFLGVPVSAFPLALLALGFLIIIVFLVRKLPDIVPQLDKFVNFDDDEGSVFEPRKFV